VSFKPVIQAEVNDIDSPLSIQESSPEHWKPIIMLVSGNTLKSPALSSWLIANDLTNGFSISEGRKVLLTGTYQKG
jgi:hypothetical protein